MTISDAASSGRDREPVGIAEYALATDGTILATSGLGSCVGVALHDPATGIAGLVHVMLPAADGEPATPAKYADTGIEALLDAMAARGAERDRVVAKIAGGSDMLGFDTTEGNVGARNVEAVRETLAALGVDVVADDVGGEHGRSLELHPDSGTFVVSTAHGDERTL